LAVQEDGPRFQLRLAIKTNPDAHRTLELRSFFRQFPYGWAPEDYYSVLKGELSTTELCAKHPREAEAAKSEAWLMATSHLERAGPEAKDVQAGFCLVEVKPGG
jgi:hypothetical protein